MAEFLGTNILYPYWNSVRIDLYCPDKECYILRRIPGATRGNYLFIDLLIVIFAFNVSKYIINNKTVLCITIKYIYK